jgi:predicted AlkP superfamily phosphohydrolase/phosphomutase
MIERGPQLVIIGIDGASHRLVRGWSAAGKLPILSSLAASDRQTPLLTAFPPHTAPGWASIFSGVGPGEHGIYQFWELQARNYRPSLTTVGDFGREPLWRILERSGLSVGLYNVPMTHPPAPIQNGFMVTWPLTPTLGYAFPRTLIHELAQRGLHYKSDLVTMYREDSDYISVALEQIERKTDTLLYLLESHPVDALFAVYTELDRVSHCYWGTDEQPGPEVAEVYRAIDDALGRLLVALDPDVPVLIVSDHGFGLCRSNLNVNVLLEQAGLLRCRAPVGDGPREQQRTGVFGDADLALSAGWFASPDAARVVDWTQTRAYMPAPGCFGINLNLRGRQRNGIVRDEQESAAVAKEIADAVASVRIENEPAFVVVPRDDVYKGHRLDQAPDLILLPQRWDIMPAPSVATNLWTSPTQAGVHREDGILFAKNFRLTPSFAGHRVEDIVPTCLARLGLPIPEQLDGHVLEEGCRSLVSEPARRVSRTAPQVQNLADQVQIEKRLAQLGYL